MKTDWTDEYGTTLLRGQTWIYKDQEIVVDNLWLSMKRIFDDVVKESGTQDLMLVTDIMKRKVLPVKVKE